MYFSIDEFTCSFVICSLLSPGIHSYHSSLRYFPRVSCNHNPFAISVPETYNREKILSTREYCLSPDKLTIEGHRSAGHYLTKESFCQTNIRNPGGERESVLGVDVSEADLFPNRILLNWWRRRESNPRPKIFHCSFYMHSLCFYFTPDDSRRQDSTRAIPFFIRLPRFGQAGLAILPG